VTAIGKRVRLRTADHKQPQPAIVVTSMIIGAGFGLLAVAHTALLLAAAVTRVVAG
jgi:hypothetical protein